MKLLFVGDVVGSPGRQVLEAAFQQCREWSTPREILSGVLMALLSRRFAAIARTDRRILVGAGGAFASADGDNWHDFAGTDELNGFELAPGDSGCVTLKWDDWPASRQDYDLHLWRVDGSEPVPHPLQQALTAPVKPGKGTVEAAPASFTRSQ